MGAEHPGPFHGFPSLGDIWEGQDKANLRYLNNRLRGDVDKLAKENSALSTEVATLRAEVARLREYVQHLEEALAMYRQQFPAAKRAIETLSTELTGDVTRGKMLAMDYVMREDYKAGRPVPYDYEQGRPISFEEAESRGLTYIVAALRSWPHCTKCGHTVSPDAQKCRDCGKHRYRPAPEPDASTSAVDFDPGSVPDDIVR